MDTTRIGIILNGVTGRMGATQHLARSVCAIIRQGGVPVGDGRRLAPEVILTGRDERKLKALAERLGPETIGRPFACTTDVPGALDGKYGDFEVFFDASGTRQRAEFVEMALRAGKAVYCEKPTAATAAEAVRLARLAEEAGVANGVVRDKLWLPGFRKLRTLKERGFFGRILSVRGEFGYWVFTGLDSARPAQRPSWNYRSEDGGGIILDMFSHYQYLVEDLFGPIRQLVVHASTDLPERRREDGTVFPSTADDSAYAMFLLADSVMAQFNSSWCTRVRRDDLLTVQVDGVEGSAVAGLREVWTQSAAETPRPVWNPDLPQPIDFRMGWTRVPDTTAYDNPFKVQWEEFLKHVAVGAKWSHTLREGARGVQLAELGLQSWKERRWVSVPAPDEGAT